MLDLPKRELIRNRQQVRNPGNNILVVWIEPWADRFELAPQESIEVVFVGPDVGQPEVLPHPGELVIYGWSGSEVIVLRNGKPAGNQANIEEIVTQELELAHEQIVRTHLDLPKEEIDIVQHKLLEASDLSPESRELACELVSHLVHELASHLQPSDAAAMMLWQIADRVLGTMGLILAAPSRRTLVSTIWKKGPVAIFELIANRAISVLPGPMYLFPPVKGKLASRRRRAESESVPKPH